MQLNASTRSLVGKRSRRLHGQGKLAAVVYGHSAEATPLVLDRLEFQKVFVKSGRTHLVDLVVDGDRSEKVLVREIQTHPRRLGPIHVDFYRVSLEEVDLTPLEEIESELRVSDLNVPKAVTVLADPDELVVKIVHKRELKVEEEIPAAEAVVPAEGEAAAEGEAPAAEEAAETEE